MNEEYKLIVDELKLNKSINPINIFEDISKNTVMHGIIHHFVDGASFLTAYCNALDDENLEKYLVELYNRSSKMPGGMCGYWGVCGSTSSLGAALSIIHEVKPLSSNNYYSDNFEYTSKVLNTMSKIGGPRCCKRNAYISILTAIDFINDKYNIRLEKENVCCKHSFRNKECLKTKCPFYKEKN